MKKLILFTSSIIIAAAVFSFKLSFNHKAASNNLALSIRHTTLNGVDEVYAKAMIKYFDSVKIYDKHPLPVSIWISKQQIHAIARLLNNERKQNGLTDGLRIYFVCDTTQKTYPLNTSVLFVTTKDSGESTIDTIRCPSKRNHHDYYEHNANDSLFKIGYLGGQICYGKKTCEGSDMYRSYLHNIGNFFADNTCPNGRKHHISTFLARRMVGKFKNHPINTNGEWFDIGVFDNIDKDPRPSGIRIYFATHPHSNTRMRKPFSNRDAFVLVPTYKNGNINQDYFDCNSAEYFMLHHRIPNLYRNTLTNGSGGQGEDDGELCPDVCN